MGTRYETKFVEQQVSIYFCDGCGKEEYDKFFTFQVHDTNYMYDIGRLFLCKDCFLLYKNKKLKITFVRCDN